MHFRIHLIVVEHCRGKEKPSQLHSEVYEGRSHLARAHIVHFLNRLVCRWAYHLPYLFNQHESGTIQQCQCQKKYFYLCVLSWLLHNVTTKHAENLNVSIYLDWSILTAEFACYICCRQLMKIFAIVMIRGTTHLPRVHGRISWTCSSLKCLLRWMTSDPGCVKRI